VVEVDEKPLIALDVDGVLYRWTESAIDTFHALRGLEIPQPEGESYDLKDWVTKDDWHWLWNSRAPRRRCFGTGRPYADGVRAAWELEKLTRVILMTSRPANVIDVTMRWASAQHLRPHALVHVPGVKKWQHEFIRDCKLFIDDKPENALGVRDELGIPVFVPRRTYNGVLDGEPGIVVFNDWTVVLDWVRENLNAEEGERG
jgi:uncharacterized HAD superfamily protein